MKKIFYTLLIFLITITLFGQSKQEVDKIIVDCRNGFGNSGKYEIDLKERRIKYNKGAVILNPDGSPKIISKRLTKRKLKKLKELIDLIDFEILETKKGSGFDGIWYFIDVTFLNGKNEKYEIWSGEVTEPLNDFFLELRDRL